VNNSDKTKGSITYSNQTKEKKKKKEHPGKNACNCKSKA
jgi:hypothetical protein